MPVEFKFDLEKALAAVSYFASHDLPELTKGKLSKLLFLADRSHVLQYGRPITGDAMSAMEHGPIPSNMLNVFDNFEDGTPDKRAELLGEYFELNRTFTYPRYQLVKMADLSVLSRSDIKILEKISKSMGIARLALYEI